MSSATTASIKVFDMEAIKQNPYKWFTEKLRERMKDKNIRQSDIAVQLNSHQATISAQMRDPQRLFHNEKSYVLLFIEAHGFSKKEASDIAKRLYAQDFKEIFGDEEAAKNEVVKQLQKYEVHPDWVRFAVYGSVSAGSSDSQPLENEYAYFPLEKIKAQGLQPKDVRAYIVNGNCMVTDSARRVEKNIAPKDYIFVDITNRAQIGDVVVAWWPEEEKMIVKQLKVDRQGVVLYPFSTNHKPVLMPDDDALILLGRVIGRTG